MSDDKHVLATIRHLPGGILSITLPDTGVEERSKSGASLAETNSLWLRHMEEKDAEIARLRALIDGLECTDGDGCVYDCRRELPGRPKQWCDICKVKQEAEAPNGE